MLEKIRKFRRDLHQIPELELVLPKTKQYVLDALDGLDCQIESPIESSVVAFFNNDKANTIAFRSDMDALPVQEMTDISFKSKHQGCMHACGHDGHMALLLEFAHVLNTFYKELSCNVLLIFQPGEESPGGAKLICQSKILEKYKVKEIYGTHLWPFLPAGQIATIPGAMMARSSEVNIDIFGKTSHAAKYKEGIDALEIGARYLLDLYHMESQIDSKYARLLRFGRIESGTVRNVVSDHCHLEGTMRALDEDIYQYLKNQLYICADAYPEANFQFSISEGYPVVYNDIKLVCKIQRFLDSLLILDTPEMISEDFSWYQQYVPGVFFFLGTGTNIPLHNSHFNFDESILLNGIQTYTEIVKNA